MKLSDERLAEFNGRMNDWISKQGLIFQLTHGGTGLGGRPPIVGSFIRAIASLTLLALLAGFGFLAFLFWKATGDELPKQCQKGIAQRLSIEKVTANGFERTLSSGSFKQILAVGDDDSFYNHLDARNISFQMGPLNGLFGDWDAKKLKINELNIALKAGEADQQRAQNSWQSFFKERPSFTFAQIEISKATLTWGYTSAATWGSIIDSELKANRILDGWSLKFKGGTFSQGIFRDFTIEELLVELTTDGDFEVTKATLAKGEGTFHWSGKMTSGGAQPTFEMTGQLSQIPVDTFLPRGLLTTVNGTFSGDLSASGSTNNSDGISFKIQARPEGEEGIYLTKELTLLRMLSHLDPQRSYRKVPFNQGTFQIETKGKSITFSEIDLASQAKETSKTIARLKGQFSAKPAEQEDLDLESLFLNQTIGNASETIGAPNNQENNTQSQINFGHQILRQFKTFQFRNPHLELVHFTKDTEGEDLIKERIELAPRRAFRVPHRLEGSVELAVPGTAFESSNQLPQVDPDDDQNGLRTISLDLNGLVIRSSQNLAEQWEEAMEDTNQNDF